MYVLTFARQNNNTIERVRIKDGLICDHEVYANCKPWYISNQEQQKEPTGGTTQPEQPKEDTKVSPVTGAAAKMQITTIAVVLIIVVGIIILKRRKNKS